MQKNPLGLSVFSLALTLFLSNTYIKERRERERERGRETNRGIVT
jgi:hypothetical protein